ncbi:MAG: histidine phosphatase family protein [Acidobacteriota bacterium]
MRSTDPGSVLDAQAFQLRFQPAEDRFAHCKSDNVVQSLPLSLPHPVELHVMRHGETDSNARNLITGSRNVGLTTQGAKQARAAGKKLSDRYDIAFSSTLYRSMQTLDLALKAGKVSVDSINRSPFLNERSLGDLELQKNRPISSYANGDLLYAPPGGESYAMVTKRVLSFLCDLAQWIGEEWTENHRKVERVLLCTHMGPMRIMTGILYQNSNPVLVLRRSFKPAQILKFNWKSLKAPPFHPASCHE